MGNEFEHGADFVADSFASGQAVYRRHDTRSLEIRSLFLQRLHCRRGNLHFCTDFRPATGYVGHEIVERLGLPLFLHTHAIPRAANACGNVSHDHSPKSGVGADQGNTMRLETADTMLPVSGIRNTNSVPRPERGGERTLPARPEITRTETNSPPPDPRRPRADTSSWLPAAGPRGSAGGSGVSVAERDLLHVAARRAAEFVFAVGGVSGSPNQTARRHRANHLCTRHSAK